MTEPTDAPENPGTLVLSATPAPVEPGAILAVAAQVTGVPPRALSGRSVTLFNADGIETAHLPIIDLAGTACRTEPCEVTAPNLPGAQVWRAELALEDGRVLEARALVTIAPHRPSVNLWDMPTAIERGTTFRMRVGIKCPHGCPSDGWGFDVRDHSGATVLAAAVGHDPWPGTEGLRHAEIVLPAPEVEGAFDWTVTARGSEEPCAHAERSVTFRINSVRAPEYLMVVEAVDAVTRAPVAGARVVAHPYRTVTDDRGGAELRLPGGAYTVFVSGKQYFAFKAEGTLAQDMRITAEMHEDRVFSDADAWA